MVAGWGVFCSLFLVYSFAVVGVGRISKPAWCRPMDAPPAPQKMSAILKVRLMVCGWFSTGRGNLGRGVLTAVGRWRGVLGRRD